jgi:hypothetical protein
MDCYSTEEHCPSRFPVFDRDLQVREVSNVSGHYYRPDSGCLGGDQEIAIVVMWSSLLAAISPEMSSSVPS